MCICIVVNLPWTNLAHIRGLGCRCCWCSRVQKLKEPRLGRGPAYASISAQGYVSLSASQSTHSAATKDVEQAAADLVTTIRLATRGKYLNLEFDFRVLPQEDDCVSARLESSSNLLFLCFGFRAKRQLTTAAFERQAGLLLVRTLLAQARRPVFTKRARRVRPRPS